MWGELLIQEIKEELQDDIAILEAQAKRLSVEPDLVLFQKTIENDVIELQTLLENLDNWNRAYSIANSVDFITWPRNKVDSLEKENAKNVRDQVKKKIKAKVDKIFVSSSEEAIQDIQEMYKTLVKLKDLIFEFDGYWFYKKSGVSKIDFMSYFFDHKIEKPSEYKLRFFAPPKEGINSSENCKDWLNNYYTVIKELPEIRIEYEPVEIYTKKM